MKAFYLTFFMATGLYFPYLSLYLQSIHLSGVEIGAIASIPPLAGVLLQPLWGLLSDRFRVRKAIVSAALLCAAVTAPLAATARSFAALLPLAVLLAVALSPATPLSDAATLERVRREGGSYGAVRIYGSLGYLITSLSIGSFYSGAHIQWLYPLYGALLFAAFLVSLAAPRQDDGVVMPGGEGLKGLFADRTLVIFLLLALVGYATYAASNTFFALYLKQRGAGSGVVGLAAGLASFSELPVMALAGRAIRAFGVKPLLLIGLGAACVRWFAYGLLSDYRLALLFTLLHGLAFAGFYVAGVTFVDERVPPALRASGQAVFNGATFGLGTLGGSYLFGYLFDRLHVGGMFIVAGALCAGATAGLAWLMPARPAPGEPARKNGNAGVFPEEA